jgi:hypothetical protein
MSDFPACLLVVTAEIDGDVEDDWNTWYDEVHLPDALACPGVIGGRRYVSLGEASVTDRGERKTTATRTYTTIYELAGPEVLETAEFKAMRGWYQFAGRIRASTRIIKALSD